MTLKSNAVLRGITLCLLYAAQGIPRGFIYVVLPAHLTSAMHLQGLGDAIVATRIGGLLAFCSLPWAIKWVWGPVIDRISLLPGAGKRRPWIILAQLSMIMTLLFIMRIPNLFDHIQELSWLLFAHNLFCSLQDVAVDALAFDVLPERERGRMNGLMHGASRCGLVLGGAGSAWLIRAHSVNAAILGLVIMLSAIVLLPLFIRECPGDRLKPWRAEQTILVRRMHTSPTTRSFVLILLRALKNKSAWLMVLFGLVFLLPDQVIAVASPILLINRLGWSETAFSYMRGGLWPWCGVGGAIVGGWMADRFGVRKMIAITGAVLGCIWIVFSCCHPLWGRRAVILAFAVGEATASGCAIVLFFTLAMGVTSPRIAASQLALYAAMLNVSQIVGSKLVGPLVGSFDMVFLYFACGVIQLLTMLFVPFIVPLARQKATPLSNVGSKYSRQDVELNN